ncbi:MAG: TetR family transcriptional regulator [Dehalococcoidia bacterium]|nr:TetR family transcriptional regulator [Dehalococcoidia bacterium]
MNGHPDDDGRRARGVATRETILDVATRHFAKHGYRRTLLEEVAADAGVSKGLIRFHFASKDGLAVEVLRRLQLEEARWIAEAAGHKEDPPGALARLLERQHMHRTDRTDLAAVTAALAMEASQKPAVREQLANAYTWYRGQVEKVVEAGRHEGIFRDDISASALAGLFLAALDGVYMHRRLGYEGLQPVRDSIPALLATPVRA